uniref:Putative secreted protein n=1 Tax=Anopheles darlingi TaxID=43151 RepID=A0A2M4DNR7_ANODA
MHSSRLSSWPMPMLWPIMCAIVPASRCGSYGFISTLIPTAFGVHTVSGTDIPTSPPANVSPVNSWVVSLSILYKFLDV